MTGRSSVIASTALAVLITGGGWLYPLASFALQRLSLSGMHDEATGFLYFYSLRRLYGVDEVPWLHSGQIPSLWHLVLQLGLTVAGYPPTQLHPRLDIWTYLAPALPLAVAALLLGWAVLPLRSWLARVLVAVIFIAVIYETAGYLEYPLTTSGYHPWVHPVAVILLGWLLRVKYTQWSFRRTMGLLGLYAGFCLSIKPSYLPFVVAIGALLVLRQATVSRALALPLGSALIAVLVVLVTTWGMYVGHADMLLTHFQKTAAFVQAEVSNQPPGAHVRLTLARTLGDLPVSLSDREAWIFLAPTLFAIGLALPGQRRLSLALLLGSLLYAMSYDRRPTTSTQVEVYDFLVVAMVAWVARVLGPPVACLAAQHGAMRRFGPVLATVGLGAALIVAAFWANEGVARFTSKMPPAFQVATDGEHQLERFIQRSGGRTLFAFVDYGHRPVTVDAAIHRGGMSVDAGAAWTSQLIQSMFEDRFYVTGPGSTAVTPRRYRTLIYAYRPGISDEATVRDRMRLLFGIRLEDYACTFTYAFWDTPQPQPATLTATVIARGCTRLRQRDVDTD